ncbi:MAG TPA: SPFH domain-containing protein [Deinococcales bacterium]|nr:SPFH domain-containing protein [Deinococcales bacterium]
MQAAHASIDRIVERPAAKINGFLAVLAEVAVVALTGYVFWRFTASEDWPLLIAAVLLALLACLGLGGFFVVQPNAARVLIFLGGRYTGTVRDDGFWWTNPLTVKKHVSLRVRNFNSERLKVNDAHGNPIEIAAVVVWRVVDAAEAVFDVEDYKGFVAVQSETAIRALASRFPYDEPDDRGSSLRGSPDEVADALRSEVQARLSVAGVEVTEARLSHLAYAPEIAQAMLRRQQAQAIIAARTKIVDGAVGMVEMALRRLREERVVELDEDKTATMVNNLLVALVSEREAQPVINAGSIY